MPKRKICVVTGSRADYGLLFWVMKGIQSDPDFELQIIATGMHLSPEFGLTYRVIESDGFTINSKVEMLLSSDTAVGVTKSIGVAVIGFADALDDLSPDIVMLLGDRFEILAAAQAALIAKLPIAHIAGGDTSEGAFDEAIRHCITKISHLHFTTNEGSKKRVRQLGENPQHIYNVGSPGIDYINRCALLKREDIERELDFRFRQKNILITYHPPTLDRKPVDQEFNEVIKALDSMGEDFGLIFSSPNADSEGTLISRMVEDYVRQHSNAVYRISLGQQLYLSAISQVDVVVGNSSSGLYEVPSFNKPTVNIGDRQKGRLQASSVINCATDAPLIIKAIEEALTMDCSGVQNPYGEGDSSEKIISVLKKVKKPQNLLKKQFFELS